MEVKKLLDQLPRTRREKFVAQLKQEAELVARFEALDLDRRRCGITVETLAQRAGYHPQTYRHYRDTSRQIQGDTLANFERALETLVAERQAATMRDVEDLFVDLTNLDYRRQRAGIPVAVLVAETPYSEQQYGEILRGLDLPTPLMVERLWTRLTTLEGGRNHEPIAQTTKA